MCDPDDINRRLLPSRLSLKTLHSLAEKSCKQNAIKINQKVEPGAM